MFRDLGLGGLGEEAATLQLPFFQLLQQLSAHQPHDRRIVGEDAYHLGAAFDFLVHLFKRVNVPHHAPVPSPSASEVGG